MFPKPKTQNLKPKMSTPLFLLLGLTIATCVIAYWSDNLGKKLGKKRVSLFGLRPRQTATLMTMTSSVVIMCFTLGVLIATNSGLRGALLRYDKERSDNRDLRAKNQNLRNEQKELTSDVTAAQTQAAQAKKSAQNAKKLAQSAQKIARDAQSQERDAHQKYDTAKSELQSKQTQLRDAKNAQKTAQNAEKNARNGEKQAKDRVEKARLDLNEKQEKLTQVKTDLNKAQSDLTTSQSRLRFAKEQVKKTKESFDKGQNEIAQQKDNSFKAAAAALKFQEDLLKANDNLQKKIDNLKMQQVGLEQDVKGLSDKFENLKLIQRQLSQPSRGDIDIEEGAVYADGLIMPRSDSAETSEKLRALLVEGREAISRDKALLAPQRSIKLLMLRTGQELPQDTIINSLSQFLQGNNVPASVRLVALRYHVKAETEIECAFKVVFARPVFARNEIIVSKIIDGSQSDAQIFGQLWHDLLDVGALVAKNQGVDPILRGDQKLYADGTNERIFEALRRIQAIGKPVEVRLVADNNLTAIDQLRVRFQVGPQTSKSKDDSSVGSAKASASS